MTRVQLPTEAEARAALEAIPEVRWRPFGREDLPAIAEFYAQCETHDDNPERQSLDGLQEYWDSSRSRPDMDTLVGFDPCDRIIATAWAGCNRVITDRRGVYLGGAVRPDRRGEGIGSAVLGWEVGHGIEWDRATRRDGYGPLVMRLLAPADQADVRDLAERHGLATERYFFEMSRPLFDTGAAHVVEGISIVGWDPERSTEVHRVVDQAFQDHWGHVARTDEMWDEVVGSRA